jgi:hypothetical protein
MAIRKRWLRRPKVYEEADYQSAFEYNYKFEPRDGADYKWVATYAEFNFRQLLSANEALDSKAESLITVFAGGSGLISIGAAPKLSEVSIWVASLWGLALFLALMCVIVAYFIRFPKETFLPPSVAWALEYVRSYDLHSETRFLAQWHLACEGIRLSNARKSRTLKMAMNFGVWAVITLGLSFGVAFATMGSSPSKASAEVKKMSEENSTPSAPNPSTQPQTPAVGDGGNPASVSGPQTTQAGNAEPAIKASPQSIQESRENQR